MVSLLSSGVRLRPLFHSLTAGEAALLTYQQPHRHFSTRLLAASRQDSTTTRKQNRVQTCHERAFHRSVARAAKKKGGKGDAGAASSAGGAASNVKYPVDFIQVFQDMEPVKLLPDEEYPEWLWTIGKPLPSLADLRRTGFDNLNDQMKERYIKLERKHKIKAKNFDSKVIWSSHVKPRGLKG